MPLLVFLLLVILVATFGFWDTLSAILGGIGILALVVVILFAIGASVVAGWVRRRRPGRDLTRR